MLRRGPNKPSAAGLLIPFADAIKLLSKLFIVPALSSPFLVKSSVFLFFVVPAILWLFAVPASRFCFWSNSLLAILVWSSVSVYALLAAGWGSNSKYSTLGGTRCIAQCISYEVCLTILLFAFRLNTSFVLFGVQVH